jgi:hypothetical protein
VSGLSRLAFWAAIGGVSVVEPILTTAYEREGLRAWRDGDGDAPHGQPWFTSFHASAFPGDDPLACGRLAMYGLMGLPDAEPISPRLRAMFDVGTDLEHNWVRRFAAEGVLLSKDVTAGDEFQTGFVDVEHWLTGNSDAIVLPPFWRKGHICEIKTTSHDKVESMRADPESTPWSHAKYLRQIKTYIGLAHEAPFAPTVTVCSESWALLSPLGLLAWCPIHESFECERETVKLEPPDDGTIIYSSREEPLTTASYYVTYDPDFMAQGRAKLAEWHEYFLRGELPPHVHEGQRAKWSVSPCQYCDYKKTACKPDYEGKVRSVANSKAIEHAKTIRPDFDYDANRRAVLERWNAVDPLEEREETAA